MRALTRGVVAGTIAVALLGVIFVLLRDAPEETVAEGVVFTNAEPVDVKYVTVNNDGGEYSFYFEEDGYVLDDVPPKIADMNAFISFMTNCGRLSATGEAAEKNADLGRFGLLTPAAEAEIGLFDGTVVRLTVGDMERISGDYYAAVDGYEGVYVMPAELVSQFLQPKTQIISRFVTPPLAVSSPLSAVRDVTFTGGGLKTPVTINATAGAEGDAALTALSFGTATHIVRGAGVYQLDQTYGVEILGSLFGITASDIAGYGLDDEEIAAYGFDEPYMTVEFDMVNGVGAETEHVVLKVVENDDARFYATVEGSGAVYIIGREPFIDIEYEKLLLRWFLTPMLMDVKAVSAEWEGGSYRFDIDNSEPRNPVVTHNGLALDTELFRSFFRLITSAANDGVYLGEIEKPDLGCILTLVYEYENPGKKPDIMEFYPGDVRRANVFINGSGEFAMKDLFVERVRQGCENLVAGGRIEENW